MNFSPRKAKYCVQSHDAGKEVEPSSDSSSWRLCYCGVKVEVEESDGFYIM